MTGLLLLVLAGCPRPAPTGPTPGPVPAPVLAQETPREPPLPPPAPVALSFSWPDGSACLMATRRTEAVSSGSTMVSNLTGVGSGVVVASRQEDGTWGVSLEDRHGTARHSPLAAELLTALEELELELEPTLIVAADGAAVTEVRGVEGVLDRSRSDLEQLAEGYNTEVQALWREQLPQLVGPDALEARWRALWAEGWGFAYGRTWTAAEPVEIPGSDGATWTATYEDVVPCKLNEDEPLCIRIRIQYPEQAVTSPDARIRAQLPAGYERESQAVSRTVIRSGELVVEAGSGLPWRWTAVDDETHIYSHGDTRYPLLVRRRQDVSCDWRVAE